MISEAENNPVLARSDSIRADAGAMGNITIDCVVLGFSKGRLKVLVQEYSDGPHAGLWSLLGGWVQHDEGIDQAAHRHLSDLAGVDSVYLEQLKAFGNVKRVTDRRIVTVAYVALLGEAEFDRLNNGVVPGISWRDLDEPRHFIFDHNDILNFALKSLRHKVRHEPIGFNLLPIKFTLLQLQELYEAVLGVKLDKPNFRRKMMKMKLLIACGEKQQNVAHRAAELYRFDREVYQNLCERGFAFEV